MVSELSDDAPERETVVNRIISRSKETIAKLDTVMATLKTKKATITTEKTKLTEEIKELSEKLTGIQAKIVTAQETLKLKTAERTSKKEILKGYTVKETTKTASSESAIIT
jgi:chromosome segregation ATPase